MRISNIEQGISNYEVTLRTPESAGAIYQRRLMVMPDAPLRHSTFLVRYSIFVLVGEGETLSQQHWALIGEAPSNFVMGSRLSYTLACSRGWSLAKIRSNIQIMRKC